MRIETLQYFVAAANCRSMSHAGDLLHVSQQSISKEILFLENTLQKKLFKRSSSKGISLTEEGEKAYAAAVECLKYFNRFMTIFTSENIFNYNFAYISTFNQFVENILQIYSLTHTNIGFNVFSLSTYQVEIALQSFDYDIIIHQIDKNSFDELNSSSDYVHHILISEPLLVMVNKNCKINDIFRLHKINDFIFQFFSYSPNEPTFFEKIARQNGYSRKTDKTGISNQQPKCFYDLNYAAFMTNNIFCSGYKSEEDKSRVRLVPTDKEIEILTLLSIKKEHAESSYIKDFVKIAASIFQL